MDAKPVSGSGSDGVPVLREMSQFGRDDYPKITVCGLPGKGLQAVRAMPEAVLQPRSDPEDVQSDLRGCVADERSTEAIKISQHTVTSDRRYAPVTAYSGYANGGDE